MKYEKFLLLKEQINSLDFYRSQFKDLKKLQKQITEMDSIKEITVSLESGNYYSFREPVINLLGNCIVNKNIKANAENLFNEFNKELVEIIESLVIKS